MTISIDFETYSDLPLGGANGVGVHNYASHGSARVLCMAYKVDDADVDLTSDEDEMRELLGSWRGRPMRAWNANFERTVIRHTLGIDPGSIERWSDPMAHARLLGLPGALGNCAQVVGLPQDKQKDAAGKRLIRELCVPQTREVKNREEKLQQLYAYCKQDVLVESTLAKMFGDMLASEAAIWRLDNKINERGLPVDLVAVAHLVELRDDEWTEIDANLDALTGVENAKNPGRFASWLKARGYPVPNLRNDTLTRLREAVRRDSAMFKGWTADSDALLAMELYSDRSRTPAKKLEAFARLANDGRIKDSHSYHAASTGRWSSHGVQLQNLPRPSRDIPDPDSLGDELVTLDRKALEARANVSVTEAVCSSLRSMICAPPGKRLIVADFSAIEARVTAYLAGEQHLLDTFASDGKVYEAQAATMFNVPRDRVSGQQRLLGKVAVLALGFAGGVGAFRSMGQVYGLPWMEDAEAQSYVDAYRAANPAIRRMWYAVEEAALNAVGDDLPGLLRGAYLQGPEHCVAGPQGSSLVGFHVARRGNLAVLRMRLPSGRHLHYWSPKLTEGKFGGMQLAFTGVDTKTRRWGPTSAWRGLLVENVVQATARDLLANAMLNLDAAGYAIVGHVHDEVIIEAPGEPGSGEAGQTLDDVVDIMTRTPPWLPGIPLGAEGQETRRFGK